MTLRLEPATGRYLSLPQAGVDYRVYFEEAGSGVPLLLQHTAGSDGRQWRHLLADAWVTDRFRVIAWDLPYHGKSLPPEGVDWWESEYRLTRDFLLRFVVSFSEALELSASVFMGCSMGGHLALDLALEHPNLFRAVIGLEAAAHTPASDPSVFAHPRVGGGAAAALMMGLTSPTSPEARRRETAWGYAAGAPGVFAGDLHYYGVEHDLRADAHRIDTQRVAVHVLTGEYDWSATPSLSRALVAAIPGAHFTEMKGIGHFPMCEDPERFRAYLIPVLEKILADG